MTSTVPTITQPRSEAIYQFSESVKVYWVLISDVPLLLADLATLIIFCRILFYIKWRKSYMQVKPSRPMLIYLLAQTFWSATSIGYPAYNVFRWRSPEIALKNGIEKHSAPDQYNLFWTGQFQLNYFATAPLAVLFITFDRCLAFWPAKRKFLTQKLCYANLIMIIGPYFASMTIYLLELPLNIEMVATCRYATCLMKLGSASRPQLFMKTIICIVNLVFTVFFFVLFYQYKQSNPSSKISLRNRFVKFTLIIEVFFEIIPSLAGLFFNLVPGYFSYTTFVDIAMAFCALDAAICGLYYSRVFLKKSQPDVTNNEVMKKIVKIEINLPLSNKFSSIHP